MVSGGLERRGKEKWRGRRGLRTGEFGNSAFGVGGVAEVVRAEAGEYVGGLGLVWIWCFVTAAFVSYIVVRGHVVV